MNETKTAGISPELSATDEWKSLGPNLKQLLVLALQSNLPAAIKAAYPNLDEELQRQIADELSEMPIVNTLGVAVPLPVATSDKTPVAPSADAPVLDSGVTEQVN
jgi:hypothetical protein